MEKKTLKDRIQSGLAAVWAAVKSHPVEIVILLYVCVAGCYTIANPDILDINRDWPQLVKDCLNILAPGGKLYFSTNSERIKFDISKIPPKTAAGSEFVCKDITEQTIPVDFAGKKPHKVWEFTLK